jgi:FkbM family methyltransferase
VSRKVAAAVHELPNGLRVASSNAIELAHFYEDIFEKEVYVRHGVALADDAVVLDVGANIGLFSLFVLARSPRARVYAFEPAPPLYDLLRKNLARHGARARCFNLGLAKEPGAAPFTFYPHSTGMSSFFADEEEERRALGAVLENEARRGEEEVAHLLQYRDDYLAVRLTAEAFTCRLGTLSGFLRDERLDRVDLVKIDVQKAEWDVLQGIAEEDWPRIAQLAIEVHDFDGRVRRIADLLAARGYAVAVEQDELYRRSEMFNLYAVRRPAAGRPA